MVCKDPTLVYIYDHVNFATQGRYSAFLVRGDAAAMTFQDVRPDIDEAVLSQVVEVSPPAIRARSRSEIVDVDDAKGADRCQRRDVRTAQPIASVAGPDVLPRVPAREIELADERVSAFAR